MGDSTVQISNTFGKVPVEVRSEFGISKVSNTDQPNVLFPITLCDGSLISYQNYMLPIISQPQRDQEEHQQQQQQLSSLQSFPSTSDNNQTAAAEKPENNWRQTQTTIISKLSYILTNEILPDLTFIVGPEKIKISCHKFILMISSSVLEQQIRNSNTMSELSLTKYFTNNMTSSSSLPEDLDLDCIEIVVPNVSEVAVKTFLKFIYTDKFEVPLENATEVLSLAKRYDVQNLVGRCLALLKCNITEQNVLSMYHTARELDESELCETALAFIFRNPEKVINSPEFHMLSEEDLCYLLKSDDLVIDELILFNATYRWGLEKATTEGLPLTDIPIILKNILQCIRFPLLSAEQLTLHVAPKEILDDSQLLALYKYLSLKNMKHRNALVSIPFSTRKRGRTHSKSRIYSINRWENIHRGHWSCGNNIWKLDFMVNRSLSINGYGFLGSYEIVNALYEVEIQLITPNKEKTIRKEIIYAVNPKEQFQVKFHEPIPIIANVWYTAAFTFLQGPPTLGGTNPSKSISLHCGDFGRVTFSFRESDENTAYNQLSQILFSLQ